MHLAFFIKRGRMSLERPERGEVRRLHSKSSLPCGEKKRLQKKQKALCFFMKHSA